METLNFRVADKHETKTEEVCYSVSVKVPLKEELLRILTYHLQHIKSPLVFRTGILSTVQYAIDLCIFREYSEPKIGVCITLDGNVNNRIVEIIKIDINYVSQIGDTMEDSLTSCSPPKGLEIEGKEFWEAKCGWPENTSIIFLLFHVTSRNPPHLINEEVDFLTPLPSENQNRIIIDNYFLSEEFSDVIIECGNTRMPAHRLILANRSKYFAMMFSVSMKETREGVIKIDDMNPEIVKEFLRFIYQNKIEHLEDCVKDLFIAADKYGMEDLRAVCERHLLENLSIDNVMEVYDLCKMHGNGIILKKAKELLIWNKKHFAPDAESFKEFTCKYPELMFELFTT